MGRAHTESGRTWAVLSLTTWVALCCHRGRKWTDMGLSVTTVVSWRERSIANVTKERHCLILITKKNLWLCKWTSEIHSDYVNCTNWKYQMEADCFVSIYIREIIFTLCTSISLSSKSYSAQHTTPKWRLVQPLQQTVQNHCKRVGWSPSSAYCLILMCIWLLRHLPVVSCHSMFQQTERKCSITFDLRGQTILWTHLKSTVTS